MAKRFFSILLVLAMILSLSACSLLLPQQQPGNEQTETDGGGQIEWPLVNGVWAADVNGVYELVWMDTQNGNSLLLHRDRRQ